VVSYRARRFTDVIDLDRVGGHAPSNFFEPILASGGRLLLEPEEFYIFASRELIRVPPHLAAEMTAYDVGVGELRTNYAGFFDAGFGYGEHGEREGTRAVLEVRPHDVPFLIEDGQVLFKLEFSRTVTRCLRIYGGPGSTSSYAEQGLTLAKYFRED
jgi:dCTP deaminase